MKKTNIFTILSIIFLFMVPLIFPEYWVLILSEILIMGLFAISFNLLFGYSGLLSFGHAGFFGVGAYTAALLIQYNITSIPLIILIGIIVSIIISSIIGFLSVKHDEIYFAMITLAFGMMLFTIAHNWTSLTGGSDGLPLMTMPVIKIAGKEFSFFMPQVVYYFTLIITIICEFILWRIVNSHFGLILTGMRENKNRLIFSGANIRNIRLFAFVISAVFSSIAGIIFCFFSSMATPDSLHWSFSAKPVIMSVLGGAEVFLGPIFGSIVFYILEQIIRQFTDNWMIFLGIFLIPIVIFFPKGILGTILTFIKAKK
jgi:branched-chain amino acid transport system permease protein